MGVPSTRSCDPVPPLKTLISPTLICGHIPQALWYLAPLRVLLYIIVRFVLPDMLSISQSITSLYFVIFALTVSVHGYVNYANVFVDPDYIVNGGFGHNTLGAQEIIVEWAQQSSIGSPWCTSSFYGALSETDMLETC